MKVLILLLIVFAIFFGCATLGYQAAQNFHNTPGGEGLVESDSAARGEQHNLLILRVDRMDVEQPRLISVWFVSLFFQEGNPTTLTLAQIYPASSQSPAADALARSFGFTPQGEPLPDFWDAIARYKIQWEGYVLIDTDGANLFLGWLVGPGDYLGTLDRAAQSPQESVRLTEQTCLSVASAASREIGDFNWGDLVPAHFRSSLRLETGLAYWDRVTRSGQQVRCEVIPAP